MGGFQELGGGTIVDEETEERCGENGMRRIGRNSLLRTSTLAGVCLSGQLGIPSEEWKQQNNAAPFQTIKELERD